MNTRSRPGAPATFHRRADPAPRRTTALPASAALLALVVSACGDPGGAPGGETAAAAGGLDGPDVLLAPVTEDLYTVGAFDGEDWETFGTVESVAFDSKGNLHVLDEGANRVVVVDPGGELVRTVGKAGDGPGELGSPRAFAVLSGDRLAVFDFGMPGAFDIFDADGSFAESATVDMMVGMLPGSTMLPLPGDRLLSPNSTLRRINLGGTGGDAEDETEVPEDRRPVVVFSLDGTPPQVVYQAWDLPPTEESDTETMESEGGTVLSIHFSQMRAFEPGLHVGVLSDGRVAVADSVGHRVKLVTMDGVVDGVIERPIAPVAVTRAIEEAESARRLVGLEEVRLRGGGLVSGMELPDLSDMMKRQVEGMTFAAEIPVIAGLGVDREDRIWVARTAAEGFGDGPIDIVTPGGEYVGTVPADGLRIPAAFGPDGLMAYIEADELEIQSVRVVRLVSLGR